MHVNTIWACMATLGGLILNYTLIKTLLLEDGEMNTVTTVAYL